MSIGGEGSFSSSTTGTRTTVGYADILSPEQKKMIQDLATKIGSHIGGGVASYGGTTVPDQGPVMDQYMGSFDSPAFRKALSGASNWESDPAKVEDYWQKSFYQPAMNRFKSDILPQIRETENARGTLLSGGRHRAEVGAASNLATNLEAKRADLLMSERMQSWIAQESAGDRQFQAQGQVQAGGLLERAMAKEPLQEDYEQWQMRQPWANPWLNMAVGLAGTQYTQPYARKVKSETGTFGGEGGYSVA